MGRFRVVALQVGDSLSWLPALFARIALFFIFAPTGLGKLRHLPKVTSYFVELGLPAPHFNAVLVGASEFVCGALLLIGLLARYAAIPLIIDMAVAIAVAKWKDVAGIGGFFALDELLYIALLLFILVGGAGAISIDGWIGYKLPSSRRGVYR